MMESLIAFYFGWTMGSRSGPEGAQELNDAIASLKQSEEFAAVMSAVRKHAAVIVRDVADRIEGSGLVDERGPVPDVLARVHELIFTTRTEKEG